jgi:SAM-dependent methyltransferase
MKYEFAPTKQTETHTEFSALNELLASESCLQRYNAHTVTLLSKYFDKTQDILEFGAGIGTLAQLWWVSADKKPDCLEIDKNLKDMLTQKGFNCYSSLKEINRTYDGIYTSNVLEHIEDDVTTLKEIQKILRKDSLLAIYVPAFMCLYSGLDVSAGHYRRYGKKELLSKLELSNYEVIDCHYVDSLGFFASLALKYFGYKDGAKLGNNKNLKVYDKFILPISKILDTLGLKHLFGKNILVIAREKSKSK